MAKRANPYSEDFTPQTKIYVGMKQFNNNEFKLKKVYEKTLSLLFNGAKKRKEQVNIAPPVNTAHRKELKRQLLIGKDGTLVQSDNMITLRPATVLQCTCKLSADSCCTYCERPLCESCQQMCNQCKQFYCSHCYIFGSEGSSCVSCYG